MKHLHSQHIQLFKNCNKDLFLSAYFPPFPPYIMASLILFSPTTENLPQLNDVAQSQTSKNMLPLHSVRSLHVNEGKTFTELPVSLHISPSHTL